ncbi:PTS sugar transporter subunit IIA [Enterococcus sp. 669A]|uniref:PTS sugar transporter subunit IIA n=1 Tax=Candidatus Enterococcus moelleringii TaxID=2815325 RepID=A0ABS3L6V1_9ENTE|nr:PTS sugar transporter subunit IIA [Enterococcus sp. 669A]MBO1305350.1 PTS sugar transporter subunit IIA [Enterococcus sp. 669A]
MDKSFPKEPMVSNNEIHAIITEETERDRLIYQLAEEMAHYGMVGEGYGESVLEREREFPTGVPTPVPIAIPHSERSQIFKQGIGVAVLKESVKFASMENPDCFLDVKVVFMLAANLNNAHLDMIKDVMEIIQDSAVVANLLKAETPEAIEKIMHHEFSIREEQR